MIDRNLARELVMRWSGLIGWPKEDAAIAALIDALEHVPRDAAEARRVVDDWLRSEEFAPTPAAIWRLCRTDGAREWQSPRREPRKSLEQTLHGHARLLAARETRWLARTMHMTPERIFGSIDDAAAHWAKLAERDKTRRTIASLLGDYAGDPAELCQRLGVTLDTELERRDSDTPCTNCRRVQVREWIDAGGRVVGYACRACSVGEWIPADLDVGAARTAAEYRDEIRAALRQLGGDRTPRREPQREEEASPAAAKAAEAV